MLSDINCFIANREIFSERNCSITALDGVVKRAIRTHFMTNMTERITSLNFANVCSKCEAKVYNIHICMQFHSVSKNY